MVGLFLQTERMVLRRFTLDDVDDLLALDSDPAVRRFVEDGEPVSRQTATDMIEYWLTTYPEPNAFGFWAATATSNGGFLGWFHLRPQDIERQDEVELGYRLLSSVWGQGYATEGSLALIDHGFQSSQVARIVAETMVVHTASRRVMEKAGMQLVRTFHADWPVRIPGDEHGDVEYAITRAEWKSRQLP